MNILTPAALEDGASRLASHEGQDFNKLPDYGKAMYRERFRLAFNAAIAKLIEEERAFDNLPGWENEIIIKKVKP